MYRSTTTTKPQVHVAIPALDELEFLPACLESLHAQTRAATSVWICVNQPESWWSDPLRRDAAERNAATLTWISSQ
ncbi:MAG: glycosyltransferase family 2 protein, partial [Deltaproteobacteria bacterium]|nr:glycosyltransferase family 2 protein [Deltaproteobacteria bacterium]